MLALRSQAPQVPERNVLSIRVDERDVYLVGTMHYNPVSLQRVGDTIDAVAGSGTLSSVVIESCASRYEKWKDVSPDSLSRRVLESEMQVACDRAKAAGVELILGDQPIEDVGTRTKELFNDTVRDLLSPLQVFCRHCRLLFCVIASLMEAGAFTIFALWCRVDGRGA